MSRTDMMARARRALITTAMVTVVTTPAWIERLGQPTRVQATEAEGTKPTPVVRGEDTTCRISRRRFWSERDGWIVRRVPSCG
jgi:hypothetical protein